MIIGTAFEAKVATLEGGFWTLLPGMAVISFFFAGIMSISLNNLLLRSNWREEVDKSYL